MKKSFVAFLCGLLFSGILSFVVINFQKENIHSKKQIYYIQTGVYQTKDNATSMQLKLSELDIEAYVYQKDGLHYVICGICDQKKELDSVKNILSDNQISLVCKEEYVQVNHSDLAQQLMEVLSS